MYRLLVTFLFIASICSGVGTEASKITVRLKTRTPLTPLYLDSIESVSSDLSAAYLQEIDEVLRFDLKHAGTLHLLDNSGPRSQLARQRMGLVSKDWQREGAAYVLRAWVNGRSLSAKLTATVSLKARGIDGIELSGDLDQDRRSIHLLSDAFHKEIFGINGIASTKFLYCVRDPNPEATGEHDRWLSEVWEADYDGYNARQVTFNQRFCVTPCYMPPKPGKASGNFLFVSYRQGQPKIHLAPINSARTQRLTTLAGNQLMPTLPPQRDQIAFVCDAAGNPDLFVMPFSPESGPTGKPVQIYSSGYATQASPTFSPDGKQIAFVSNKDGPPRVYVMDVPQTRVQQRNPQPILITRRNRENTAPSWSPDGSKLVYSAKTDNVRQIWIYDFSKDEEWQLTHGPGHKENPTWAPNGRHIVFNSVDGHKSELYLVNLNQGEVVQVSCGKGQKYFPSWDPAWR